MKVGLTAIEYALPERRTTLTELEKAGLLDSTAEQLHSFGFEYSYVSERPADLLAAEAVRGLMRKHQIAPESVDAIFYAGAFPASHAVRRNSNNFLAGFNYPAAKLQYEFGLSNATVVGISQVGCLGLMKAIGLASDFLVANPQARRALCVSSDVLPADAKREVMYNLISDGACAVQVEKDARVNCLVSFRQISKGYYWDCIGRKNEIIAAYFPTAQNIVRETLVRARVNLTDIKWVIPHNVSRRSWEILLGLLGLPPERLFADNIAAFGHIIAADNFINLKDAQERGQLQRGDRLLLFNFGFGTNWGCMLLEH